MPRRRRLTAHPLLVVTTGATLAVGCTRSAPVGNIMAPVPMNELCVDTIPPNATVLVNGQEATDRCTLLEEQRPTATVQVSADNHMSQTTEVTIEGGTQDISITLAPAPPVGNLMPPQEVPPPVLNPPEPPPENE